MLWLYTRFKLSAHTSKALTFLVQISKEIYFCAIPWPHLQDFWVLRNGPRFICIGVIQLSSRCDGKLVLFTLSSSNFTFDWKELLLGPLNKLLLFHWRLLLSSHRLCRVAIISLQVSVRKLISIILWDKLLLRLVEFHCHSSKFLPVIPKIDVQRRWKMRHILISPLPLLLCRNCISSMLLQA